MGSFNGGRTKARQSRCVSPRGVPAEWVDYSDEDAPAIQEFADWLSSLHPSVAFDLVTRMDELQERAAHGEIQLPEDDDHPADLDAIRMDPHVFELRWTLLSKQVRQYHAEPQRLPDHLVKLHLHIKGDTLRRNPRARAQQEKEIGFAVQRYRDGESHNWGVP